MTSQHVTRIDEDDASKNQRFTPRCSCGWVGTQTSDRRRAARAADVHRAKAVVDDL